VACACDTVACACAMCVQFFVLKVRERVGVVKGHVRGTGTCSWYRDMFVSIRVLKAYGDLSGCKDSVCVDV
jgi:hypothetical protein